MKLSLRLTILSLALAGFCHTTPLQAQGGPGPGAGLSGSLTKLFGEIKTFSAKAEMRMLDASGKEIMSVPMDYGMLNNNVRMEMDLTKIKSASMPPQAAAQMAMMGMGKTITLVKPDQKKVYIIYPGLSAYLENPLPAADTTGADSKTKITKTELGKETIDGHPCVKNKVVITDESGKSTEATTWEASDLKSFPIKTQITEGGKAMEVTYRDINLTAPATSLFDLPANYTAYTSSQQLMGAAMQKIMSQQPGAARPPGQ